MIKENSNEERERPYVEGRVAVYWDIENIHISLKKLHKESNPDIKFINFREVMEHIKSFGPIMLNKAYANWLSKDFSLYSRDILEAGIDSIQLFPHAGDKNSADMSLTCDALTDIFNYDPDIIVLLTGDSDYIPLVKALKKLKKFVLCIGVVGATSTHLISTCDRFDYFHNIVYNDKISFEEIKTDIPLLPSLEGSKAILTNLSKSRKERFEKGKNLLIKAIKILEERMNKEEFLFTTIGAMLKCLDPSFSSRNYGYEKLKEFLESYGDFIEISLDKNNMHLCKLKENPAKI